MNKKLINTTLILIALITIFAVGCSKKSEKLDSSKAVVIGPASEATPLTIDKPNPRTDGMFTIKDADGNIRFQYSGEINITNDGKNGEEINIEITLPEDEIQNTSIVLYDKGSQSIKQYVAYPEYKSGTLKLIDAEQTYLERDREWEDKY